MLKPRLQELCICRPILEDALIGEFLRFLENPENTSHAYAFTAGLIEKAELLGFSGNILRAYFLHALAQAENTFARTAGPASSPQLRTSKASPAVSAARASECSRS